MAPQFSIGLLMRGRPRWGGMRAGACLAGLLLVAGALDAPARAQGVPHGMPQGVRVQDHPAQLNAGFDSLLRNWMSEHQIAAASLAAMKDKRIVTTLGYGGMNAAAPARIASLSKAITAVCVARLVDQGRLSFTTPLGAVLANTFRRFGLPVDPALQHDHHRATAHASRRPRARSRTRASSSGYGGHLHEDARHAAGECAGRGDVLQQYRLPDPRRGGGSCHRYGLREILPRRVARADEGIGLDRPHAAGAGAERRLAGVGRGLRQIPPGVRSRTRRIGRFRASGWRRATKIRPMGSACRCAGPPRV